MCVLWNMYSVCTYEFVYYLFANYLFYMYVYQSSLSYFKEKRYINIYYYYMESWIKDLIYIYIYSTTFVFKSPNESIIGLCTAYSQDVSEQHVLHE